MLFTPTAAAPTTPSVHCFEHKYWHTFKDRMYIVYTHLNHRRHGTSELMTRGSVTMRAKRLHIMEIRLFQFLCKFQFRTINQNRLDNTQI